jgi:hypothetical protein
MKTTKAYLAGLGTTGILIGSVVLVLVLGSGFAAFSVLPGVGPGNTLDRVVVEDEALAADDARGARRGQSRRAGGRAGSLAQRRAQGQPVEDRGASRGPGPNGDGDGGMRRGDGSGGGDGGPGERAPGGGDRDGAPGGGGGGLPVADTGSGVTDTVDGVVEDGTDAVGEVIEGGSGLPAPQLPEVRPPAAPPKGPTDLEAPSGRGLGHLAPLRG